MALNGVRSTNIQNTALIDKVLGNRAGSTRQIPINELAFQLANTSPLNLSGSQAPLYPTEAALRAATIINPVSAWVYDDPDAAKNGIWAHSTGDWAWALPLPYDNAVLTNTGSGTPSAIIATSAVPLADGMVVFLPIVEASTSSPVTVTVNGIERTLVTKSGHDVAPGGLLIDMRISAWVSGNRLYMIDEQAAAAIVAAAEAAAERAEASAAGVNMPPINAGDTRKQLTVKADESGYELVADVHVHSVGALAALRTDVGVYAYLSTNFAPGSFILRNWADFSAAAAVDTEQGYVVRSTVDVSKCWVRVADHITPQMFGAVADGVANDYPASLIALAVAKALKRTLHFPAGDYRWDLSEIGTAEWDPTIYTRGAWRAIPITGEGSTLSSITIENATNIGWYVRSASGRHWFNPTLSRMTVRGALAGPLLAFGRNDFADFANMIDCDDLAVENSLDSASNRAVRLNGLYGGSIRRPRFVAYALAVDDELVAVNGYALEARQAEFISIDGGGLGNAVSAVRVVDGVNLLLSFTSVTMENVDYCVDHQSSISGHHKLTVCQLTNVRQAAARSGGILTNAKIVIEEPNISGGVLTGVDPTQYEGILIRDRSGVTTPAAPASTLPLANTTGRDIEVAYWGPATVTGITLDGFARGVTATSGTFLLRAGSTVAIGYTGSLNWLWTNVG